LFDYDKMYLGKIAKETGFVRDTLEKVYRLADVLEYLNTNPLLSEHLALKGGTAINLTVFNMPRLSVDIDLDYLKNDNIETMLETREHINKIIAGFMFTQGYLQSAKTKTPHSLDSWVYSYTNAGGNRDLLKLEINYSLRAHILPAENREITTKHFATKYKIKTLGLAEIFGSKICALLNRTAARDLYDVSNMIKLNLFDKDLKSMLRKCVVFYNAISSEKPSAFDTSAISLLNQSKIKTDLLPMIRNNDKFDLETTKVAVITYIQELMTLTGQEIEFLNLFQHKEYHPELLFDDNDILQRVVKHPMAIWKARKS